MKGLFRVGLIGAFMALCASAAAQSGDAYGAYSPYSVFGIGDIAKDGTAFNKSMGGIGVATRNRRYINTMNPASLSSIDSSSFMADFGLMQTNKIFNQKYEGNKYTSANNTFNINNFVMAFPIYRTLSCMVGITPYSNVGYDFSSYETDQDKIGNTSTINYTHYGEGSVYQLFVGAGTKVGSRLSAGAEMIFYFGTIDKVSSTDFYDAAYQDVTAGSNMVVRSLTGKLGLQYEQPFGRNLYLTVGATYKFGSKMRGETAIYEYGDQSSMRDTISYTTVRNRDGIKLGDELGLGISLRKGEKWMFEVDYLRSDWTGSGIDNASYTGIQNDGYTTAVAQAVRAGFEIVPNRNDIRYYRRRIAYRGGVYYDESYYKYCGNTVSTTGVTFGVTLPVYRLYNGLTLGVDFGKKGNLKNDMVRELYCTFNIGFNIHDLWFHKPKYD